MHVLHASAILDVCENLYGQSILLGIFLKHFVFVIVILLNSVFYLNNRYPSFPPNDVQNQRDAENAIADKYLLRLMTATLVICNTLRREEYRVL